MKCRAHAKRSSRNKIINFHNNLPARNFALSFIALKILQPITIYICLFKSCWFKCQNHKKTEYRRLQYFPAGAQTFLVEARRSSPVSRNVLVGQQSVLAGQERQVKTTQTVPRPGASLVSLNTNTPPHGLTASGTFQHQVGRGQVVQQWLQL